MKSILKLLSIPFKPILCEHDYMLNGWTSVKCKKCGWVSRSSKDYNMTHDGFIKTRSDRMRKWGMSDEEINNDNAKIKPF